jgi:hypothetical protein
VRRVRGHLLLVKLVAKPEAGLLVLLDEETLLVAPLVVGQLDEELAPAREAVGAEDPLGDFRVVPAAKVHGANAGAAELLDAIVCDTSLGKTRQQLEVDELRLAVLFAAGAPVSHKDALVHVANLGVEGALLGVGRDVLELENGFDLGLELVALQEERVVRGVEAVTLIRVDAVKVGVNLLELIEGLAGRLKGLSRAPHRVDAGLGPVGVAGRPDGCAAGGGGHRAGSDHGREGHGGSEKNVADGRHYVLVCL